jgi:hypothetical protein
MRFSSELRGPDRQHCRQKLKKCEGCVPPEEIDGDVIATIHRKFAAVYQTAVELAQAELKNRGLNTQEFNFCVVIDASYEDATHVVVVDRDKPFCYLQEWEKAWHFHFGSLTELAQAVLDAKTALVKNVKSPPLGT